MQDTTAPILTVPADVNVTAAVPATVDIGTATATDIFNVTITNDAPATYAEGATVVTWTATDANGNGTQGTQNVTVTDVTEGIVDTSYILNYEASSEGLPSDGTWNYITGQTGFDFTISNATLTNSPQTSYSGITQAWQFDGTGGGTMESLQDISGNPADADASFELWIRPTDLIDSDLVFETGGSGDGISVIITDADSDTVYDDLQFIVKDSGSMATLTVDLSAELGDVSSEFFQLVGVYDRDYSGTTDRVLVYLNATFIAENQAYTVLNDWAGGNNTGLGRVNGSANIGNTTNFEGDIAIVRFYEKALTETEVQGNFNAINGGVE